MGEYTGDTGFVAQQSYAVSHNLHVVTAAQLADSEHPVNLSHLSGKNAGAQFVVEADDGAGGTTLVVVTALGPEPTDAWVDATGTEHVVPA